MTGLEIGLIFGGIIIVIVTFLFGEQLDGKESKDMLQVDEEQIKNKVREQVDNATVEVIDDTVEKTSVELDKISNEKIMAVNEYSETVLKEIEMNHEEVMFLYGMLNDKEEQIKNAVRDVEMVKQSIKHLQEEELKREEQKLEEQRIQEQKLEEQRRIEQEEQQRIEEQRKIEQEEQKKIEEMEKETSNIEYKVDKESVVLAENVYAEEETESKNKTVNIENTLNNNEKILALHKKGKTNIDIAKELKLGLGEVRLVLDLYKSRGKC